ncbi:MAG: hypothetical protein ACYDHU_02705 [Acidimicrobiales bacterium]
MNVAVVVPVPLADMPSSTWSMLVANELNSAVICDVTPVPAGVDARLDAGVAVAVEGLGDVGDFDGRDEVADDGVADDGVADDGVADDGVADDGVAE